MLANVGPPGEIHEEAGNLWNYMHDMHYTSNVQCTCLCFKTSTNILDVCKHVCIFGAKKIQALLFHELHPSKGGWDWIKSEERCSKDKKVYSHLGIFIRDCYPSWRIQKMHHHLWHEGSLSASGSKQNGLIMCKMGDHVHSTIIVSLNITSYLLNLSFIAPSKSIYCMSQDSLYNWQEMSMMVPMDHQRCGHDTDHCHRLHEYSNSMITQSSSGGSPALPLWVLAEPKICHRLPGAQHGEICSRRQIEPRPRLVREWMILYCTQPPDSRLKSSNFLISNPSWLICTKQKLNI